MIKDYGNRKRAKDAIIIRFWERPLVAALGQQFMISREIASRRKNLQPMAEAKGSFLRSRGHLGDRRVCLLPSGIEA